MAQTLNDTAATPLAQAWAMFRSDPVTALAAASEGTPEDLFHPDAHIVFVPTGSGAAGAKYIRQFYQTGSYSHPKRLDVQETVIHRTVGEASAVDEVEVTVKFVTGAGGWLLPGIQPYNLADLTITFPMVVSASFSENRITSIRHYWDNASVLKMVRLIGNRQSWPIVAEAQVDALREPSRFRLNPFGDAVDTSGSRPSLGGIAALLSSPPVSPPQIASSGTRPASKPSPALSSTLFSHLSRDSVSQDHAPLSPSTSIDSISNLGSPTSPSSRSNPTFTSTIFGNSGKVDNGSQQQQSDHGRDRAFSSGSNGSDQERPAGWRPDYTPPKGHPALTSTIFSKNPNSGNNNASSAASAGRQFSNTGSNIFGSAYEIKKPSSALDAELERNRELQQELKETVHQNVHDSQSSQQQNEDLHHQMQALEALALKDEDPQVGLQSPLSATAPQKSPPTSVISPIPSPPSSHAQSAQRKLHPNYKSQISFG